VAQLVEGDPARTRAREALLEALAQLRGIQRPARLGVAEDQVGVAAEGGALEVTLELGGEPVCHRHRPPLVGLRRVGLANAPAGKVVSDPHPACHPVDVLPRQCDQLALAQAGHGRGQVERSLDRSEGVLRDQPG